MAAQVIQHSYTPFVPFQAFHRRHQRLALMVCSRRAGKTVAVVNDMVARAMNTAKVAPGVPRPFYAYVAPLLKQAKAAVWETYLLPLARELNCKTNAADLSMTLPNGAVIRVFGADNPDSFRGLYFDGVILDEFGDMKSVVWTQNIRPALSDRKGWAVFIGTPKGKNAFYKMREQARKDDGSKWFFMELPASKILANGGPSTGWGTLTHEEVEASRIDMDEDEFQQEFECSFDAANLGSYYGKLIRQAEQEGRLGPQKHIKAAPVHVAFDLGWSDSTVAWYFQVIDGKPRVLNHQEWSQIDIKSILQDVASHGYKLGDMWLPHDAKAKSLQTGKSMIEQFWAHGLRPRAVPELSILDGIQAVRSLLPIICIDKDKCEQGIEALKEYKKKWDPDKKVFGKTPDHNWASHSADAFRYLCLALSTAFDDIAPPDLDLAAALKGEDAPKSSPNSVNSDVSLIGVSEDELFKLEQELGLAEYARF